MPQQPVASIQNNFTKGLLTEFTGLNFPENAATSTDNCTYSLIGDVTRRGGINCETNFTSGPQSKVNKALSSYKWNNVGGDGNTQVVVEQIGEKLIFYRSSTATVASPLSTQLLSSTVNLPDFLATGGTFDVTEECQFTDGNGYLFVVHPNCDPIYCTYNAGTITGNKITVQIRDFIGVPEAGVASNVRPTALTPEHNYNLINQGWVAGNPWSTLSTSNVTVGLGPKTFTVSAALTVTLGDEVTIIVNHATSSGLPAGAIMSGNVTAYAGTSMTINVTSGATGYFGIVGNDWVIVPRNTAYIASWFSSIGNYPSNSDVWWYFKDSTGAFSPSTTISNVSLGAGNGPRGHFILDAFSQQRGVLSSLAITPIQTTARPKTGCWFQGRIWYTGVDAQQPATGDVSYYTWTENIYFSQIVRTIDDFGHCYQVNDPTSETLFDLLPTDGGVINIQGCGSIYKLYPIQNGLLVFAGNGIWFITGSQGIGFTANDYTITKLSGIQSISSTSFVDVNGLPYFWNEEGIYAIQPAKGGGLEVDSITVGTIAGFYDRIPKQSKRYVRGAYHPIDYVIQWLYKDTAETDVTSRYEFNRILNYNTYNKAFYPYSVPPSPKPTINGITYVSHPHGDTTPAFKYYTSILTGAGTYNMTFSEESETYTDWLSVVPTDYSSFFITGYQVRGQAQKIFFPGYVYVFTRTNDEDNAYKIQGFWDYANSGNSGRWSSQQVIRVPYQNYNMVYKKHKIRGHGLALQFRITSVSGQPFDIMGWSSSDNVNTGI